MKNKVIPISLGEADQLSIKYFINVCGLKEDSPKFRKLMDMGMETKALIMDKVNIQALVSSFEKWEVSGNMIKLDGITFVCDAFEQINAESIKKIYAYIITAGNMELDDAESVLKQYYADVWGTVYVDAGLEVLKKHIMNSLQTQGAYSKPPGIESFGPGFYGMDVTQIGNFFNLLDADKIGVRVKDSSLMLPLKSCAGFFVVVEDESKLPPVDCISCAADHKGCNYCQYMIKKNSEKE